MNKKILGIVVAGCHDYNQTIVEKNKGDDWFCSEAEAQKAGFQKSANSYGKKYSL